MYAQISTAFLGTYAVTIEDRNLANLNHPPHNHVITDQTARTIASWYHSPGECCTHITALSHGMPFDTDALREQIHDEIEPIDADDAHALLDWLHHIEVSLPTG